MLPPSTVVTSAVVFNASACDTKCLRDVVGGDLALQQVAAHVVLLGHAARLGALLDEVVGHDAGADAVGIDGVGADAVARHNRARTGATRNSVAALGKP